MTRIRRWLANRFAGAANILAPCDCAIPGSAVSLYIAQFAGGETGVLVRIGGPEPYSIAMTSAGALELSRELGATAHRAMETIFEDRL